MVEQVRSWERKKVDLVDSSGGLLKESLSTRTLTTLRPTGVLLEEELPSTLYYSSTCTLLFQTQSSTIDPCVSAGEVR